MKILTALADRNEELFQHFKECFQLIEESYEVKNMKKNLMLLLLIVSAFGVPNALGQVKSELIYRTTPGLDAPVVVKDSIYIETHLAKTYWKMPGKSDYTSWVPKIYFEVFYRPNQTRYINYSVEYYNPDGSLWFAEKFPQGITKQVNNANDGTTSFKSEYSVSQKMVETKGSIGTGIYGVKIINDDTRETQFQGKFKVGKVIPPYFEDRPNHFAYYVDHDWLMPLAYIGFDPLDLLYAETDGYGGFPVHFGVWLKEAGLNLSYEDVEGHLFYKGQPVAVAKGGRGGADLAFVYERRAEFAFCCADWQFKSFVWDKFLVDNNLVFARERYPDAHFIDKNPGEYTVKVFVKGVQVREVKFTVQPDGKINDGGVSKQLFLIHNKVVLPAKVMGNVEKWNPAAWKTEAFYGNPLTGFTVP